MEHPRHFYLFGKQRHRVRYCMIPRLSITNRAVVNTLDAWRRGFTCDNTFCIKFFHATASYLCDCFLGLWAVVRSIHSLAVVFIFHRQANFQLEEKTIQNENIKSLNLLQWENWSKTVNIEKRSYRWHFFQLIKWKTWQNDK